MSQGIHAIISTVAQGLYNFRGGSETKEKKMPLSSNDVTSAVAKRLKYYAEVERREDGFDLSPVEPCALTKHPLLGPGLLHDRSLKHYFSEAGVRAALQLRGRSQPEPSPPRQLTVTRHIRRHMRKTAFSQAAVPGEQDFRYYSRPSINRAPCYWPEPMSIYRRVPPPYIPRGELVRLVSSASRLIVATEAVQIAPEVQDASRVTANGSQSKNHISLPRIQYGGENKKNHKKLWVKSGDAAMPSDRTLPQKPESSVSTRGLCERGRRNSSGTHRKKLTLPHERPTISKSTSGQGRKSDADTSSQSGNSQKKGPDCVKGERKTATESAAGREGDESQGVRVSTEMDLPLEEVADRRLSGSCRGTGVVRGKEDRAEIVEQDLHVVESVEGYSAESSFSLGQMRDQCSPADDGKKDGESTSLFVLEKGGNTASFMRFQALPEGENESNLTGQPGNMGSDPGQGRIFTPTFLSHCNSEDRARASTEDVPQRPSLLSRCLALSGDTDTSTSQSLSDEEGAEVPGPHSGRQRKDAAHGHAAVVPGDEEDETKVMGKSVPVIHSGLSVERNDSTQSSEEAIFDFENLTPSLDQNENLPENMVGNHSHDNLSPQQNQRDEMPHREEGTLNVPVTHKDQTILGSSKQNIVHIDNNPMSCLSDKNQERNNHPGELDLDEENFPPFSPEEFLNPPSLRASPRDTDTMDILLSDTRSVLSDVSDTGLLSKEDKDPSVMETCSP